MALTADGDLSEVDYPRGPISPIGMRPVHVVSVAESKDSVLDHWEPQVKEETNGYRLEPVVIISTPIRMPPFLVEEKHSPTETAPSPPRPAPSPHSSDRGQTTPLVNTRRPIQYSANKSSQIFRGCVSNNIPTVPDWQ